MSIKTKFAGKKTETKFDHPDTKQVKRRIINEMYKGKKGKEAFENSLKWFIDVALGKNSEILTGKINIRIDRDLNKIFTIKVKVGSKVY